MSFKDLLKERLKDKFDSSKFDKLPSGFQRIGDIIVLNLDSELDSWKEEIGRIVLDLFKVRSVCNKFGEIKGEFREPQIEVLAGSEDSVTTHIENNVKYRFDVRKVMFAKGNVSERSRIAKVVQAGEVIVDMFAGIGYFTLPIGVYSNPTKIYSIEMNPVSFEFLKVNLKINHINNVEVINGDCREEIIKLIEKGVKADRVIMGYLPPPWDYLDYAFKIIKTGGVLHFEDIINCDDKKTDTEEIFSRMKDYARKFNRDAELLVAKKVKSYGPKREHWVFDFKIVDFCEQ